MSKTVFGVKRVGARIRLQIELSTDEDPTLIRRQHWDLPAGEALLIAAGLITETVHAMRSVARAKPLSRVGSEQPDRVTGGGEHEGKEGAREHDATDVLDHGRDSKPALGAQGERPQDQPDKDHDEQGNGDSHGA